MLPSIVAAIVAGSPDAVLVLAADGRFQDANPAACQLLAYSRDELLHLRSDDLIPAAATCLEVARVAYRAEGSWRGEISLVRKDGATMALEGWLVDIPGPERSLSVIVVRDLMELERREDITERKAAEAELAATHQHTREVLDRITDNFYALDRQGRFTYINDATERNFGYSRDELVGQNKWERFPQGMDTPLYTALHQALADGHSQILEFLYPPMDRWYEARIFPSQDGLSVFFRDVTDQKRSEEALRQSEEQFRTAFDHAAIGMSLVGLDGRFLQVNAALCALTGYTESELLARSFQDITHPEDVAADLARIDRLLTGETFAVQLEKRYLHKHGRVVWIRINSVLVHDEHGEPLHFLSQIEDITTRVRAEEELRAALEVAQAANQAKGAFLDMMSHELRTPLQAVLGYSEFLLSTPRETLTGEQREDIGYIHRGGSRMVALINQSLDLSRMEAGHLELATEAVDLVQVIEAVRQDVTPQAVAKGLAVHIDLPPSLPAVMGDAERVRQILLNLVGNAVKFTHKGSVRITATAATSDGIDVVVSDTGIGIAADALQHIFEAFHQVDTGLTRRHGGSGLGLAIARKLTEQMGGSISVKSEPQVGSIFRLHLPRCQR